MTSRERLLALLKGEPTDRIGVHVMGVRVFTDWWLKGRGSHPSYRPVIEAVRERTDCLDGIGFDQGFYYSAADIAIHRSVEQVPGHDEIEHHVTVVEGPRGPLRHVDAVHKVERLPMPIEHLVKTPEDAENFLALPYAMPRPDIAPLVARDREVGDRGLVLVGIGSNPIGDVHSLLGSETLAYWSREHRDLVHRLLAEMLRRKMDVIKHFATSGLNEAMPVVWGHVGAEAAVPPLHGPADFHDFVVRYDKPLHALMHETGGLVRVHCHGSLGKVLEGFVEAGADMVQPVEGPPEGDITLREAKRLVGDRLTIEGNVQIARIYEDKPEGFRRLVEQTVADGKPGGRFVLCPTASPYTLQLSERAVSNYLTLIDVALEQGWYD
ncbi:MAG: hypothetical protein JXL80_12265 [Planctomycetes bacterium]|nr:hypothetical protein [Planctomycetota bacterium]